MLFLKSILFVCEGSYKFLGTCVNFTKKTPKEILDNPMLVGSKNERRVSRLINKLSFLAGGFTFSKRRCVLGFARAF